MRNHAQETGIQAQVMKENFNLQTYITFTREGFIFFGKEFNKGPIGIKDFPFLLRTQTGTGEFL